MNKKLIKLLRTKPIEIAHLMGFDDMGELHNTWLKEMMFSKDDLTILAHRGSYKTTSLSVAIALIMVLFPKLTSWADETFSARCHRMALGGITLPEKIVDKIFFFDKNHFPFPRRYDMIK